MCIGGRRECVWSVRNRSVPRVRVVVSVGEASHTHKTDVSPPLELLYQEMYILHLVVRFLICQNQFFIYFSPKCVLCR